MSSMLLNYALVRPANLLFEKLASNALVDLEMVSPRVSGVEWTGASMSSARAKGEIFPRVF